ncbi:hypothetical protein OCA08_24360 [Bacillus cereus]|nr:hypothetical protein [Bacillus cereus]
METRKLFTEGPFESNAWITWVPHSHYYHTRWDLYSKGYMDAADCLIDNSIANRHAHIGDRLVYPIIFSYRQAVELKLKQIILLDENLKNNTTQDTLKIMNDFGHEVDKLWDKVKIIIQKLFKKDIEGHGEGKIQQIDNYIKEFAEIDSLSFTFRYPLAKPNRKQVIEGNLPIEQLENLSDNLEPICLSNLKESMHDLMSFLTGTANTLGDQLETYRKKSSSIPALIEPETHE